MNMYFKSNSSIVDVYALMGNDWRDTNTVSDKDYLA